MHLGTLEVSLKDFDEVLCWGFSRACEDWQMIQLQDWTKMRIWLWKWVLYSTHFRRVYEEEAMCIHNSSSDWLTSVLPGYTLTWNELYPVRIRHLMCRWHESVPPVIAGLPGPSGLGNSVGQAIASSWPRCVCKKSQNSDFEASYNSKKTSSISYRHSPSTMYQ